jgi:hypothetical protein
MGVGHLAASFALRGRFARIPLFYLLAAGVFVDLLWGLTILSGVERAHIDRDSGSAIPLVLDSVPYSHSLVACSVWGMLVALAWWLWRRDRNGALVLGALVVSHWVLDFVSHVADVPLLPSGPRLGLGLWNWRAASLLVELGMLGMGLALYVRATRARDRFGSVGLVAYGGVFALGAVGAFFGPPPSSVMPFAASQVALLLPLLFMDWVDRHRNASSQHVAVEPEALQRRKSAPS